MNCRLISKASVLALLFVSTIAVAKQDEGTASLPIGTEAGDQFLSEFYSWDEKLPAEPGVLLRAEDLPDNLLPSHAGIGQRILYSSIDARWTGDVLPVSGALFVPRGNAPPGGWPLVAWAHGTLGMADSCSPSWVGMKTRDLLYVDRWLEKGYAVVATDYQGLGALGPHPYSFWEAEGRSILDSIRAVRGANFPIEEKAFITGQSQGSGAALGAASIAGTYAPELDIVGVSATALLPFMPRNEHEHSLAGVGDSPYYYVYRMLGGGLPEGSPAMEELLSEKGHLLLAAALSGCNPRAIAAEHDVTIENAFSVPWRDVDRLLGPAGAMPPFHVDFPVFLGTGLSDFLIPVDRQMTTVHALCSQGNTLLWKGYSGVGHGDTLPASFEDALQFARAAFSGSPLSSTCDSLDEGLPTSE